MLQREQTHKGNTNHYGEIVQQLAPFRLRIDLVYPAKSGRNTNYSTHTNQHITLLLNLA